MEVSVKNYLGIYIGRMEPGERPDQATMVRGMTAVMPRTIVAWSGRSPGSIRPI